MKYVYQEQYSEIQKNYDIQPLFPIYILFT